MGDRRRTQGCYRSIRFDQGRKAWGCGSRLLKVCDALSSLLQHTAREKYTTETKLRIHSVFIPSPPPPVF